MSITSLNLFIGFAEDNEGSKLAADGKPFTSLLYGNGDGWQQGSNESYTTFDQFLSNQTRKNLTGINLSNTFFEINKYFENKQSIKNLPYDT